MKKQIQIQKREVEYTLKVSNRARRMRLAIYEGGSFVVTTPFNFEQSLVEKFILQKSSWVLSKLDYFKNFIPVVRSKRKLESFSKYKAQALELAVERVKYFNQFYYFRYNSVNIKNQKTRWGSCSKKGNLNFNYKIVFLLPGLADYLVVHELCHLGEFNHSQKFWGLVAKTIPNYLDLRKQLRTNGVRNF